MKAYRDIKNSLDTAKDEGRAEGMAKGMAEGLAKGMAKGLAEGRVETLNKMVSEMKREGLGYDLIEKLTGLSQRILMPYHNVALNNDLNKAIAARMLAAMAFTTTDVRT